MSFAVNLLFKTAPTAWSDASDMMHVGADNFGCDSSLVVARASLMAVKAADVVSSQRGFRSPPCGLARRLLSGSTIEAQLGIKRW